GGQEGVQAEELEQMAALFRQRLLDIEKQLRQISLRERQLQEQLLRVSKALLELNVKAEAPPTVTVKVKLRAEAALQSQLELQYVVPEAGWDPFYNLRIEDTQRPLSLAYKAKVYQDTEEDWEAVRLTLSTGNPYTSNVKPELNTYFLTFDNYYAKRPQPAPYSAPGQRVVTGTVVDESGEPLIGANVLVKGTSQGTVTDLDGKFSLAVPAGSDELIFSYVGYANKEVQQVPGRGGRIDVQLQASGMLLDEVTVTGSRRSKARQERSVPAQPQTIPLSVDKQYTSTAFEIEIPYTIPADNQPYDVHMVSHQVPADYHYAVVPKLSDQAYLTAAITNWSQYSLLSGDANLFFKGTYQGKTYLDMEAFEDTLSVSVGRDEDIIVKRERVRDKSSTSFLGSNKTVERTWKTTLRNTNDYPVDLIVEDQYPISKEDDIKIVQLEHDGGKLDEATGKVTWSFTLPAGQTAERVLKYAVRYPKKRRLLVD
ncbi:MAG: mucoidy inhibitor MuiA family protein, partial [Bacteroidetes bacterium]|nr:mucoidy inhibitor MuiA family protein [Bacteroidota bacterium]